MASFHLPSTSLSWRGVLPAGIKALRGAAGDRAHLVVMDNTQETQSTTSDAEQSTLELLTLDQVAEMLGCTTKTLYDLRCKGRGPRGFRVGPRLLFRRREIDSWLARLEEADRRRHGARTRP